MIFNIAVILPKNKTNIVKLESNSFNLSPKNTNEKRVIINEYILKRKRTLKNAKKY